MARKFDNSESARRQRLIAHFDQRTVEAAVLRHIRRYGLGIIHDGELSIIATDLVMDERRRRRTNAKNRAIYAAQTASNIAAE